MYVKFMSDAHILQCIGALYKAFDGAYGQMTVLSFTGNKIDTIAMEVTSVFGDIDEESLIAAEAVRQAGKTFSNAIGTFHECLMGGLPGLTRYVAAGYDLKSDDNLVFAEVKNKFNTMNAPGEQAVFNKLAAIADAYPAATCYLVQVIAKEPCDRPWTPSGDPKTRPATGNRHPRVRLISADRFYEKFTHDPNSFAELCDVIPRAAKDYIATVKKSKGYVALGPHAELRKMAERSGTDVISILERLTFANYKGF